MYFIVVPGYKAKKDDFWYQRLLNYLKNENDLVNILKLPNIDHPHCKEWVNVLTEVVLKNQNQDLVLIGHSLGFLTILNFLNNYKGKKIKYVVGIAGLSFYNKKLENYAVGYNTFLDYKKIKIRVEKWMIFHAKNDNLIPWKYAQKYADKLGAKFILMEDGGHFN